MPRRTVKRTQRKAHGGKFLSSAKRNVRRLTNKAKRKVKKVSKKLTRGVRKQIHKHRKPIRKVVGKLSRKKLRDKKFFDNLYSLNSIVKDQQMRNEQGNACNPNWDYIQMGPRPVNTSEIALENRRQRLIQRNQRDLLSSQGLNNLMFQNPLNTNQHNNLLQLSEFMNSPQQTPQPKIDLMKQLNLLTPSSSANLVATNSVNQALMNPTPQNIQNAQEELRLSQMPPLPAPPVPLVPSLSSSHQNVVSLPSLPAPPVPLFPSSLPGVFPRSYQDVVSMNPDLFKTGSDIYRPPIPNTPPPMIPRVMVPRAPPPPPPVKPQRIKKSPQMGLMDELKKPNKLKKTAKQSKKLSKRDEMMEAIKQQGMKNRIDALQLMEQHVGDYKKMGNNFKMNTMMQHAVADALRNKQSMKQSNSGDWSISSRSSAPKPQKKKKAKSLTKQKKKQTSQMKKSKKQTPQKVFPKVNVNNELANNPLFAMVGKAAHSSSSPDSTSSFLS